MTTLLKCRISQYGRQTLDSEFLAVSLNDDEVVGEYDEEDEELDTDDEGESLVVLGKSERWRRGGGDGERGEAERPMLGESLAPRGGGKDGECSSEDRGGGE